MFRQGHVRLITAAGMPAGPAVAADAGRLVLARGEATGHYHSVAEEDASLVESAEGLFLRIMVPTPLEHQEHAPIWLRPGVYRVLRQREYTPKEVVQVRD